MIEDILCRANINEIAVLVLVIVVVNLPTFSHSPKNLFNNQLNKWKESMNGKNTFIHIYIQHKPL